MLRGARAAADLEGLVAQAVAVIEEQQCLAVEFLEPHARAPRERMLGRNGEGEGLDVEFTGLEAIELDGEREYAQVELAGAQLREQRDGLRLEQAEFEPRQRFAQLGRDPRQQVRPDGRYHREAQLAGKRIAMRARDLHHLVARVDDEPRTGHDLGPGIGERHALRLTLDELQPEGFLELAQLRRERWLAHEATLGRLAEMLQVGHRHEVAQVLQLDVGHGDGSRGGYIGQIYRFHHVNRVYTLSPAAGRSGPLSRPAVRCYPCRMHILLIEDDLEAAQYLEKGLRESGFTCEHARDGREGLFRATEGSYDLIIADRMLPHLDGLAMLSALRQKSITTPVLILSALGTVDDRVQGLRAGGDDYLTKPFAFSELLARVEALMRRRPATAEVTRLRVADLELDLLGRRATRAGRDIDLTAKEFQLLEFLMRRAGQVVTRTMLLEGVWDLHFDPQTNLIDVHMSRLRQAVDRGFDRPLIQTVRGAGYTLRDEA